MKDDRYIVVDWSKLAGAMQPVHPGHTDKASAERVCRELRAQGHEFRKVEVWPVYKWDVYENSLDADLYCPVCGHMLEDCSGHLPDLNDDKTQDEALNLLVALQGSDLAQGRMLAAIHNKLYDEWAEPQQTMTEIALERGQTCATCAGMTGGGHEDCPIMDAMGAPDVFGGSPDDCFCPFWDAERGRDDSEAEYCECPRCVGSGNVDANPSNGYVGVECPRCHGTGRVLANPESGFPAE